MSADSESDSIPLSLPLNKSIFYLDSYKVRKEQIRKYDPRYSRGENDAWPQWQDNKYGQDELCINLTEIHKFELTDVPEVPEDKMQNQSKDHDRLIISKEDTICVSNVTIIYQPNTNKINHTVHYTIVDEKWLKKIVNIDKNESCLELQWELVDCPIYSDAERIPTFFNFAIKYEYSRNFTKSLYQEIANKIDTTNMSNTERKIIKSFIQNVNERPILTTNISEKLYLDYQLNAMLHLKSSSMKFRVDFPTAQSILKHGYYDDFKIGINPLTDSSNDINLINKQNIKFMAYLYQNKFMKLQLDNQLFLLPPLIEIILLFLSL